MTTVPNRQADTLSELDQLLLDVLVSAEPHAAWHTWRNAIDWDGHIGPAAFQLVPLVYKKLVACGIDDPLLARFKGIMRRNWVINQRVLKPLATVAQAFAAADVAYVVLPPMLIPVADGTLKTSKTSAGAMQIGIVRSEVAGSCVCCSSKAGCLLYELRPNG